MVTEGGVQLKVMNLVETTTASTSLGEDGTFRKTRSPSKELVGLEEEGERDLDRLSCC